MTNPPRSKRDRPETGVVCKPSKPNWLRCALGGRTARRLTGEIVAPAGARPCRGSARPTRPKNHLTTGAPRRIRNPIASGQCLTGGREDHGGSLTERMRLDSDGYRGDVRTRLICGVLLAASQIGWSPAVAEEREGGWLDEMAEWFETSSTDVVPPKSVRNREESQQTSPVNGDAGGIPTPGVVYQVVQDLISETALLREEVGVSGIPPELELQQERLPIHVYAKALEVLSKVIRIQSRFGVPTAQSGRIPFKELNWGDVEQGVLHALDELRKIKTRWKMDGEIESATPEVEVTTEQVYQRLSYASFLLDGLLGRPLTSDDVYLNCASTLGDLELVASELGIPLHLEVPEVDGIKSWKDVARHVKLATSRIINLQTRLGMDASVMPKLTMVRVTPSEVFDYSNTLQAETARIKFRLGIDALPEQSFDSDGKTAADVFELVMSITKALDAIAAAV